MQKYTSEFGRCYVIRKEDESLYLPPVDNREKLLRLLDEIPDDDRSAYHCLVFDGKDTIEYSVENVILILHQLILIDKIYDKEQRKEKNHVRHF